MITSTIHPPSRRQILFSTLVSVASAALVPEVCTVAALPQPVPVKERPSTTENQNRTSSPGKHLQSRSSAHLQHSSRFQAVHTVFRQSRRN